MSNAWYRYDGAAYGAIEGEDAWPYVGPPRLDVILSEYPVTRITSKGVWLNIYGTKKFILSHARKRFAYPTKSEALESFIMRKKRQITICNTQIERCVAWIHKAGHILETLKNSSAEGEQ